MTAPKRILIVGINYTPETTGIAPYTAGMAAGLAKAGFEVQVLTTPPHYPAWKITDNWKRWRHDRVEHSVNIRHLRHYVPASPTGKTRILSELTFAARVLATRKRKFDLVIAVTPALLSVPAAALIARIHRAPLAVVTQDLYTYAMSEVGLLGGKGGSAVEKLEGFALRQAQGITAIHERFADAITSLFGIAAENITVIRNWTHIETPTGDRSVTRKELGWGDKDVVALHAGNMGAKQGLLNVVESARAADANPKNKVRFILMGNGNQRAELEKAAVGIKSIEFLDPVDNDSFSDTLAAADVLVLNELPGIAEMCVPSKLTSYFATGRPVVGASNAKSAAAFEITESEAGVVVEPGDAEALLKAITDIGKCDTTAMGAKGQAFAKDRLSEEKAINAYVSWANSLIG